jgi:aminopeptidase
LGTFQFNDFKSETARGPVEFHPISTVKSDSLRSQWESGIVNASAQNIARKLMETPANHLTPSLFTSYARKLLDPFKSCIDFREHDAAWATSLRMHAFLAVSKGSSEVPKFLELHYRGRPESPNIRLALVGKGVTFDSGGISLKPATRMAAMKGDMGGAAVTLATVVRHNLFIIVFTYVQLYSGQSHLWVPRLICQLSFHFAKICHQVMR